MLTVDQRRHEKLGAGISRNGVKVFACERKEAHKLTHKPPSQGTDETEEYRQNDISRDSSYQTQRRTELGTLPPTLHWK